MNLSLGLLVGFKEIWAHKFRSFLTMLGVILGVASLLSMFALTAGIAKGMREYMEQVGGIERVGVNNQEVPPEQAQLVLKIVKDQFSQMKVNLTFGADGNTTGEFLAPDVSKKDQNQTGTWEVVKTDGPNITNFEIVDLGTDALRNVVQFDIGSFSGLTGSTPLRILGGGNDLIQISNTGGLDASFVQIGNNVLANGVFGDGLTNGVLFDVYQVTIGGTQHVVYIQDGVAIGLGIGHRATSSAHPDARTMHRA